MRKPLIIVVMFLSLATGSVAWGQSSSSTDQDKTQSPVATPTPPPVNSSPVDQSYGVTLGTGQAIPLSQGAADRAEADGRPHGATSSLRSHLIYGVTASSVYMDNYSRSSITNIFSGVISPYVGLYVPTRTGGMTLQYLGTFTPDDPYTGGEQSFHSVSFTAAGAFTRRWYWGITSSASYGSESARFAGPLNYLLVGLVPVVDPFATSTFIEGRTAAFAANQASLGWMRTQRDRIQLSVFHSYTDLSASTLVSGSSASNLTSLGSKLDYTRDLNSKVHLSFFAQEEHMLTSSCNTYGGGVGMSAKLTSTLTLDLSGGPQRTSANCGKQQKANFNGALAKFIGRGSKIYVLGWRHFNTSYQTSSRWQDAAGAGFVAAIHRFSIGGDAGYFRGEPSPATQLPLQGYFAAPLIRLKLAESTAISAGYRLFHATGGNTVPGSLQYAMVTLEWRPTPIALRH